MPRRITKLNLYDSCLKYKERLTKAVESQDSDRIVKAIFSYKRNIVTLFTAKALKGIGLSYKRDRGVWDKVQGLMREFANTNAKKSFGEISGAELKREHRRIKEAVTLLLDGAKGVGVGKRFYAIVSAYSLSVREENDRMERTQKEAESGSN